MNTVNAATDLMTQYAAYHRDRRNIATHLVGVPLIVFSMCVLLARPGFGVAGWSVTPAVLLWLVTTAWYFSKGNLQLAAAASGFNGLLMVIALPLGSLPTAQWLTWGLGLFVLGWIIQFVGHYYEGKKPAWVDDLRGLFVAPMFVTAELLFAFGWGRPLVEAIEARVGPTHVRDLHSAP